MPGGFLSAMARTLRHPLAGLRRAQDGHATVELAIALPVFLLVICLGSFEVWRTVLINQRVARAATTVADLAGRLDRDTTEGQITNMLAAAQLITRPFDLEADGRVVISAIGGPSEQKILWQRCYGNLTGKSSVLGRQGGNAPLGQLGLPRPGTDATLVVVEVFYRYTPNHDFGITLARDFQRRSAFLGRLRTPDTIQNGGTRSRC